MPLKLSQHLQQEREFVERTLGDQEICSKCHATLGTFADVCTAGLQDSCPGYLAIEQAKTDFAASKGGR
jgi:ribosomal protein L40E